MHEMEKAEAKQIDATDTWMTGSECSGSSSKVSPQTQSEEKLGKTKLSSCKKT